MIDLIKWFTLLRLWSSPQNIHVCSLSYGLTYPFSLPPAIVCHPPQPTVSAFLLFYWITSSFSLPLFGCHLITHSDSPLTSLGVSICPIKTCPDFLLSAYFFGSNFLFLCPKSLFHLTSISAHFWAALAVWKAVQSREAVHMFFYNFKVVLLHMLCPYQFQGGSSPVLCDLQNAKWEKITPESSAKLWGKVKTWAEVYFKQ